MLELMPLKADAQAWRELAARAAVPNPFYEPELLLPAVRHLSGGDGVRLLIATDARGAWIGLLPVVRLRRWHGMPTVAHATWVHPYCFLGAPLLAVGHEDEAARALLATLRRRAVLVAMEYLPADGAMVAACRRPVVWNAWERAALHRRPQDDYVETTLASKRRRELRRLRTRFEAEQGAPLRCEEATVGDGAVETFLALEASGWKGRAGTAMQSAAHADFFRETCAAFAACERLQLVALRAAGRTIAMQCNLLAGDGVFCFKLAVDEDYARYSPGVQLQVDNVHLFHDRPGLQWEDSCADPENQMINRLWPDRRHLTSVIAPGAGAVGRLGRAQAGAAVAIRSRLLKESEQ